MKLNELFKGIQILRTSGDLSVDITGLAQDSREVTPGDLFICVKGSKTDGHQFLKHAMEKGARAALVEVFPEETFGLSIIQVADLGKTFKEITGLFYGYPERKLQLIGLVGTNGKTTSTYLMKSILEAAGHKVGLIGTIVNLIDHEPLKTHNTTPGFLELRQIFAKMVAAGIEYVVMEVSSHSIHQGRVAGLDFRCGIFTNITQDHLDYHKTFEEYLRVKTLFFTNLPPTSWAIINLDSPHGEHIISRTTAKVLSYGVETSADLKAKDIHMSPQGSVYTVMTPRGSLEINLKIASLCNIYNSLGVLGAALALGIDLTAIQRGLAAVSHVPGRFQLVPGPQNFSVFIDYAHTPDGVQTALNTARQIATRRVLTVFGCGGDRDRTKRPLMGAIAAKIADYTILTSDNPRSEDPLAIIGEIEAGFKSANSAAAYSVEADRAEAIRKIIRLAQPEDQIWILGKGHENYQEFADHRTIHFDDYEIAQAAIAERYTNG
ncbi:MAG TPA: UDP-N-acetylmuramoyl-L-alanyl-D-glutamate--2,6-diaminopimelate ligase [Bacillota bacterium]|nr:UDP-N-acetylmuramoyl-L-alanyl-D-glutamate--2,6-diaminopimelate ligase [Bacillota bacterium]